MLPLVAHPPAWVPKPAVQTKFNKAVAGVIEHVAAALNSGFLTREQNHEPTTAQTPNTEAFKRLYFDCTNAVCEQI